MSRGLGRIERHILEQVSTNKDASGSVLLNSWTLAYDVFNPDPDHLSHWTPSRSQRKAMVRAMHSVARKYPQFALAGGKGRKNLFLYEPADPVGAAWAKLSVERRGFVSRSEAVATLQAR